MRNPRELGGVRDTLQLSRIAAALMEFPDTVVAAIAERIYDFEALSSRLNHGLADELPGNITDGGTIRDGYDESLDHTRSLTRDSQNWLAEFELAEQARTGIKNLRIRYNGAFGYFIEVTKSNVGLVPEDYLRKQTMKNAERYTTNQRPGAGSRSRRKSYLPEEALFNDLIKPF